MVDAKNRPSVGDYEGPRRAAALLIALGQDVSASILRRLSEEDVVRMTWEIVGIGQLTADERDEILRNFYATALGRDFISVGGVDYAQSMLEKAFGRERAGEFVGQLEKSARSTPTPTCRARSLGPRSPFQRNQRPTSIRASLSTN